MRFYGASYHMKSADWTQNHPAPLAARTALEWGSLPRYYVMDLDKDMAEPVSSGMPSAAAIAANRWLPEADLRVHAEEYGRTGFQGGLNVYRGSPGDVDLQVFAGRTIDVPPTFMGGRSGWGVYQNPGALDRLEKTSEGPQDVIAKALSFCSGLKQPIFEGEALENVGGERGIRTPGAGNPAQQVSNLARSATPASLRDESTRPLWTA